VAHAKVRFATEANARALVRHEEGGRGPGWSTRRARCASPTRRPTTSTCCCSSGSPRPRSIWRALPRGARAGASCARAPTTAPPRRPSTPSSARARACQRAGERQPTAGPVGASSTWRQLPSPHAGAHPRGGGHAPGWRTCPGWPTSERLGG
jgi:hypothetical protein